MRATTILAVCAALTVVACGEKAQTAGDFRGKSDAKPYEANFGGDKAKWESALRSRAMNQNEYKRMP